MAGYTPVQPTRVAAAVSAWDDKTGSFHAENKFSPSLIKRSEFTVDFKFSLSLVLPFSIYSSSYAILFVSPVLVKLRQCSKRYSVNKKLSSISLIAEWYHVKFTVLHFDGRSSASITYPDAAWSNGSTKFSQPSSLSFSNFSSQLSSIASSYFFFSSFVFSKNCSSKLSCSSSCCSFAIVFASSPISSSSSCSCTFSTAIPSVRYFINSSTLLANNSPSFSMTETVFSISAVLLVPLYRFPDKSKWSCFGFAFIVKYLLTTSSISWLLLNSFSFKSIKSNSLSNSRSYIENNESIAESVAQTRCWRSPNILACSVIIIINPINSTSSSDKNTVILAFSCNLFIIHTIHLLYYLHD